MTEYVAEYCNLLLALVGNRKVVLDGRSLTHLFFFFFFSC